MAQKSPFEIAHKPYLLTKSFRQFLCSYGGEFLNWVKKNNASTWKLFNSGWKNTGSTEKSLSETKKERNSGKQKDVSDEKILNYSRKNKHSAGKIFASGVYRQSTLKTQPPKS